jgi:GNAT superfamily N-acetyltransferase
LFVRARFRGKGIATALLKRMAAIAREKKCYGMRWEVLIWNSAAIDLYHSLGAKVQSQWSPVLLTGSAFENLASRKGGGD